MDSKDRNEAVLSVLRPTVELAPGISVPNPVRVVEVKPPPPVDVTQLIGEGE